MYPNTLVVWFFSKTLLEILTTIYVDDPQIHQYLLELLEKGEVRMVSDRKVKGSSHAAYVILVRPETRIYTQDKICAFLESLGKYEVIKEIPES